MQKKRVQNEANIISNALISIILVTRNDASVITPILRNLYEEVSAFEFFEIIVVDNNSTDTTVEILRSMQQHYPQIRILVLSKEYETQVALTAGLDSCIGDYVLLINKYTDTPQVGMKVIRELMRGKYDMILGRNTNEALVDEGMLFRFLRFLLKTLLNKNVSSDSVFYMTGFTRRAVNSLVKVRRKKRFYYYLSSLIGFKKGYLRYRASERYADRLSRETIFSFVWKILDASISNSFRPLRLVVYLGFAASGLNLFFLLYVFAITLIKKNITEGWITTSVMMGSMFFILFIILTVIAEYLLRILQETRSEPMYFISEEFDSYSLSRKDDRLNVV